MPSNGTKTLQFASLSFDVAFQDIFSTLCEGGTLLLITEQERQDAEKLLAVIEKEKVERIFLPFVALQHIAEVVEDQSILPTTLKEIITAGEQLQITPAIKNLFNRLEGAYLENQYGPTESHVATAYRLTGPIEEWPALPPIGRPIANTQIYILGDQMQEIPVGVIGELYIGGVPLARGYLNRPDLAAEKFMPDPFSRRPGGRLYRTGDSARWLPDGNIKFLGRKDHQVKIRGFRIEPSEIEDVLIQHRAVREAVVTVNDARSGKRLVAYVVTSQEQDGLSAQLRSYLKERLPEYMVPAVFVAIDKMPLTPSGKIDRLALSAPEQAGRGLETEFVAPRSPVEEVLAEIWVEVLGVDRVGAHDDFFDLGGHSLLATQIVSRIQETFQIRLPLRKVFEEPTVAAIATALLDSGDRTRVERTAEMLLKIARLSDQEAEQLLEEKLYRVEGGEVK
jgi:Non-ribosomal peptide synthetase modules and related proteins